MENDEPEKKNYLKAGFIQRLTLSIIDNNNLNPFYPNLFIKTIEVTDNTIDFSKILETETCKYYFNIIPFFQNNWRDLIKITNINEINNNVVIYLSRNFSSYPIYNNTYINNIKFVINENYRNNYKIDSFLTQEIDERNIIVIKNDSINYETKILKIVIIYDQNDLLRPINENDVNELNINSNNFDYRQNYHEILLNQNHKIHIININHDVNESNEKFNNSINDFVKKIFNFGKNNNLLILIETTFIISRIQ